MIDPFLKRKKAHEPKRRGLKLEELRISNYKPRTRLVNMYRIVHDKVHFPYDRSHEVPAALILHLNMHKQFFQTRSRTKIKNVTVKCEVSKLRVSCISGH